MIFFLLKELWKTVSAKVEAQIGDFQLYLRVFFVNQSPRVTGMLNRTFVNLYFSQEIKKKKKRKGGEREKKTHTTKSFY